MFGKIYKEAVNECMPNYDLKKTLMLKAAKKRRTIPIYKYSLSAAAVIILVVSAGFAGNYFDVLNNKSIESEIITNDVSGGEEKAQNSLSGKEEGLRTGSVSETEKTPYTTHRSSSVSDIADAENIQMNSDVEAKKSTAVPETTQKVSSVVKQKAEAKKETQPELTNEPENTYPSITEQPESVNIKTKPTETHQEPVPDIAAAVDTTAEEVTEANSAENYSISMASDETSSYSLPAATGSSSGAGSYRGGGGGSSARNVNTEVWNAERYSDYLGINVLQKVAGAVSETKEKEVIIAADGELSDDEWTFKCGDTVITTTKRTGNADYSGEITEINSVKVYNAGKEYRFIYKDVYFKVTGGENSVNIIEQILA